MRLAVIRESGAARDPESYVTATTAVRMTAMPASPAVPARAPVSTIPAGDRLSPVVRKLLAEHGIAASEIQGTGHDGRVKREDVLAYLDGRAKPALPRTGATGQKRIPFSSIRRRTGEQMVKSWTTVPHVLQAIEADYSRIEEARRNGGGAFKAREGYTLTYLPFLAVAVAAALAKFPHLNASIEGNDIVLHERINLGIAVDLNFEGLVVPVVKDVPGKSMVRIAREMHDVIERARANRLKPDEMTEATYTLSNSGVFGTLITAPIINPPQVAILSTDGVRKRAVVIESAQGDSIAIRPVGVLAQTFDHRVIDGAYSAAFLREVKTVIETRNWSEALGT